MTAFLAVLILSLSILFALSIMSNDMNKSNNNTDTAGGNHEESPAENVPLKVTWIAKDVVRANAFPIYLQANDDDQVLSTKQNVTITTSWDSRTQWFINQSTILWVDLPPQPLNGSGTITVYVNDVIVLTHDVEWQRDLQITDYPSSVSFTLGEQHGSLPEYTFITAWLYDNGTILVEFEDKTLEENSSTIGRCGIGNFIENWSLLFNATPLETYQWQTWTYENNEAALDVPQKIMTANLTWLTPEINTTIKNIVESGVNPSSTVHSSPKIEIFFQNVEQTLRTIIDNYKQNETFRQLCLASHGLSNRHLIQNARSSSQGPQFQSSTIQAPMTIISSEMTIRTRSILLIRSNDHDMH